MPGFQELHRYRFSVKSALNWPPPPFLFFEVATYKTYAIYTCNIICYNLFIMKFKLYWPKKS